MNELLEPTAMGISKKIEWATRFRLSQETYASENFQIMNYGIGGKISGHLDSTGIIFLKDRKIRGFFVQRSLYFKLISFKADNLIAPFSLSPLKMSFLRMHQ